MAYGQKALTQFRPEVGYDAARERFMNASKTKELIAEGESRAKRVRDANCQLDKI